MMFLWSNHYSDLGLSTSIVIVTHEGQTEHTRELNDGRLDVGYSFADIDNGTLEYFE